MMLVNPRVGIPKIENTSPAFPNLFFEGVAVVPALLFVSLIGVAPFTVDISSFAKNLLRCGYPTQLEICLLLET